MNVTKEQLAFITAEKVKLEAELAAVNGELEQRKLEQLQLVTEFVSIHEKLSVQENNEKVKEHGSVMASISNTSNEIFTNLSEKLALANKELAFQYSEKASRAAELIVANLQLLYENQEKENRAAELMVANKELAFQNQEKENRAAELMVANKELAFQNQEKENRAAELMVANKELAFQNQEKEKRAAELLIASEELVFQNQEKENRAAELLIANIELAFQNQEKENRAAELLLANEELVIQNKEKEKRSADLAFVNNALKKSEENLNALNAQLERRVQSRTLELEKSEAFNKGVLNSLSAHIAVVDASGRIVMVNNAWKKFAGENGDDSLKNTCIGVNYFDVCKRSSLAGDQTAGKVLHGIKNVLQKKLPDFSLEYPCHSPEEQRWFNVHVMKFDSEEPMAIVAHHNITERILTETELRKINKSLDDYRFALDQSSILAITDSRGYINFVNDNFCKISGYQREELIGNTHAVINSGYHGKLFFKELWQTIRSGNVWRGEIRNRDKNGRHYWVDTTIVPFMDSNNRPVQFLSIRTDISEKKLTAESIAKALHEKNTILESIGDAFFAVDKDWTITYWNYAAEVTLQKSKALVVGRSLWDVYPESINSIFYEKYQQAAENNQVIHFENYAEEMGKWHEISVYPSEDGLSVYLRDITERKQSELQLYELNEILKKNEADLIRSNEDLEQFAYVASHDLQEPLRMVNSFLSLLKKKYEPVIDSEGKKYIDFAVDGAIRMKQLILDLLEFSRVGRTVELLKPVDLNELMENILVFFRVQIAETSAIITVENLPEIVSQQAPLRQVFQNLVGNALKYKRMGVPTTINISARELPGHWEFAVADNGIGINEKFFRKIFVIFQRLHNKDQYSGTGMGLAVTQRIVENMGGNIWLTSEEEKGSTFYFTIAKCKLVVE